MAILKTIGTIFLLIVVCVQTPVGQLLKIPLLIEHFIKHQKQNESSLINFLKNHYASDHRDEDQREDEQLPFKNMEAYAIGTAILPAVVQAHVPVPNLSGKKLVVPEMYLPQKHLDAIFHPPKV